MKAIYLDYNAPIDPRVAEEMAPFLLEHFGNPSSSHPYGQTAREAVEKARAQVAAMLGCDPGEVVFTSGGSEANNMAIKGAVWASGHADAHVITSAVEHPAVTQVCRYLEQSGCAVTTLPVDQFGMVDPAEVEKAITPRTVLVTVMHSNNEVGTLQPIREIADIARSHGALMHCDCAQSVGKVAVGVDDLGVDLLSVAGHKLYAPKGVGALYMRGGVKLVPLIHGADHEQGRRAGTENLLLAVGLGKACELVTAELAEEVPRLARLRDRLTAGLTRAFPGLLINGAQHPEQRLPNTASVAFPGLVAGELLASLTGLAASAGAACHSEGVTISSVLQAMGISEKIALGTVRFSVGRPTTDEEVDAALAEITAALNS